MKDLFRQAKMGLDREIDGFLQDYKLDEYQNLYDKSGITLISYNEDSLLDRFEVPDGVTRIGDKALIENERIKEVIFSDSVKRIGNYAFYGCKNLQKVKLGKGLGQTDSMSGSSIFYGCPTVLRISEILSMTLILLQRRSIYI